MSEEQKPKLRLEIGHVLFLDIVGYSKLLISEQGAQLQQLKEIVRGTEQFRSAEAEGKLLRDCAGARIHLNYTPRMNLRSLFVEFKEPFLISLDGGNTA